MPVREEFDARKCFAMNLRTTREARGLSRFALSVQSGVNDRSIFNYEHGVNEPTISQAFRLAQALNVSLEQLLGVSAFTDE